MTICIKACILQSLNWVTTTVEKSVKTCVEWYFQSAQRLNLSRLYEGIMLVHCIHCIHWFHTLDTPLQTQTHTQACGGGGGGGGGGGRGGGGSGGGRGGGDGGGAG